MNNNAGPGWKIFGLFGICDTCNIPSDSVVAVHDVRNSKYLWPKFIACVEKPGLITTAFVFSKFLESPFKSDDDNSMSNEWPPYDNSSGIPCGCGLCSLYQVGYHLSTR